MHIEELKDGDSDSCEDQVCGDLSGGALVVWDPKRVLVGAGARALFYPTLLYNVIRNKIQTEFRWWDRVDEFVLLGAVPFPTDVPRLKALGVGGVVTLNEPYETLVSSSLYHEYGIEHLVIPTRDYLFAPSNGDICQAVEFIHGNAMRGKTTYVHCKAGRGRSTTIVLCYLVKHKEMTPEAAFNYVRSIRPRVLLASSQRQAVENYYHGLKKRDNVDMVENFYSECKKPNNIEIVEYYYHDSLKPEAKIHDTSVGFCLKLEWEDVEQEENDDDSLVYISESDLEGYEEDFTPNVVSEQNNMMLAESRAQFAARLSCLWLGCQSGKKVSSKTLQNSTSNSGQLRSPGVDIRVY